MKIVFTGGGSGGHFFPIIAVAQEINEVIKEKKLIEPELFYLAPEPYDERALYENNITFRKVSAGKRRRYFSLKNFFDLFKTGWGILSALATVYDIFPDVIFSKGGYASFPVLIAGRIFGIPVIIHESDAAPGRVNEWAGKFAERVAVSYREAAQYFPQDVVAYTGNPVRKELRAVSKEGGIEFLELEESIPVIAVLGGSQGAELINGAIINALPKLLTKYQVVHQVGEKKLTESQHLADVIIGDHPNRGRYRQFGFLTVLAMKMVGGAADIIITRAGSSLFEIAMWGVPSIVVPITDSNKDHQRKNAFAYARAGGAIVVEEKNLTDDIIVAQIEEILSNTDKRSYMSERAKSFAPEGAARKIAQELIDIGLRHDQQG